MRVLLYSAVLYLIGIAVILYFRPALMFKHDRSWKEFGLNGTDTTVFPFWLFCIAWAIVSHGLIRIFYSDNSASVAVAENSLTKTVAATTIASTMPVLAESENANAKPGYYRLDPSVMKRKGVPKYIYIGEEPPDELEY